MTMSPAIPEQSNDSLSLGVALSAEDRRREWRIFALSIAAILTIFGLLHNRWWVPGGDSDMYLVIARNLATTGKYVFNGMRVAVAPPGWPFLLAGAMKLTTSFSLLKCLNLGLMTAFLGIFFWIVRRFVPGPWTAAAVVVGTAMLTNVYELSYWFHSDPLFCMLTAWSFLAALHVRENRPGWWRVPLLLVLCVACTFVRWAGPLNWPIIAGILISGRWEPRSMRRWVIAGVAALLFTGTFLGLRHKLALTKEEAAEVKASGLFVDETARAESQIYDTKNIQIVGSLHAIILKRMVSAGHWLSWLFWEPFRLASINIVNMVATSIGWLAIVLFIIQIILNCERRQWIWLGMAAPCVMLFGLWNNTTARYLVPYTPLLLLAILQPLTVIARRGGFWKLAARTLFITFIASTAICNLGLYGIELWIAHQPDFYAAYYAGLNKDLISAGRRLSDLGATDTDIAISPRYENMGRVHSTRFGTRAAALLTDRSITLAPMPDRNINPNQPPNKAVLDWAHAHHIKYYLFQPRISPWRWHFRLTRLQEWVQKNPAADTPSAWQIWDVRGDQPVRIDIPTIDGWPTNVPGM